MEKDAPKGLRLVEKTVEVLDLLADDGPLSIAQLAERTGEPRSSLYRLIARLEQLELVEPTAQRGYYRLGMQLLRWGAATQSRLDVRDRALPVLTELRAETGLTVYLVIPRGTHAVCIERLEGERVASLALTLGGSLPMHVGAAPRALLAFDSQEAWSDYVLHEPLATHNERAVHTAEALFELLRDERARGVCISDGDVTPGIAAVGAPVYDHRNRPIAAISVSGLRDAVLGEGAERIEALVRSGAESISRSLGAQPEVIANPR